MKTILFIAALFTVNTLYAQTNAGLLWHRDSVYSKTLKEKRKIWVSIPEPGEDTPYGNQHYPVLYVLDGDMQLTLAAMVQQMEGGSGNLSFPKMIVVAVSTAANRNRDLTPTHSNGAPMQDSLSVANSGGGESFTTFLEKELIPHIDSIYPTAPYRVLFGHSFGGLFAINTLVHHTQLFNAYAAIEPSMWWDNQKLLKETKLAFDEGKLKNIPLFLGIAHTQPGQMDTSAVKKDNTTPTLHIRSIFQLRDMARLQGSSFSWKYYPDYNHGTVSTVAYYDALLSLFRFYSFDFPFPTFFAPAGSNSILTDRYKNLSGQMGYTVLPPPGFVSTLAHQLTGSKQWDRALELLTLNKDAHPESYLVYEELGDFYTKKGDKERAIAQYTIALKHNESPKIKAKLEKLNR